MNFGWLAVWVLSPDWLSRRLEVCDFCQTLRWSRRAWGRGVRAMPRLCIYTLTFALKLSKNHGKPSVRVYERRSADQRGTRIV